MSSRLGRNPFQAKKTANADAGAASQTAESPARSATSANGASPESSWADQFVAGASAQAYVLGLKLVLFTRAFCGHQVDSRRNQA